MRKMAFLLISTNLALAGAFAQQPAAKDSANLQVPAAAASSTPSFGETIRKSAAFLTVTYSKDGQSVQIDGTCFFVFYDDIRLGENHGFRYLITNRHMADPGVETGSHYPVQRLSIRLNLRNPQGQRESLTQDIPLSAGLHWVFPDDDAIDLAALPISPDPVTYDFQDIRVSWFATQETINQSHINVGDSILFTGYFVQFPGERKMQPIVREGVLAMMPDEVVRTTLKKPGHLYFADVHTFHGNSGSPVFVNVGGLRNGNISAGYDYRLLGVVSGYYPEDADFSVSAATTLSGTVHANSGISTVVPAYELKTLLDTPSLRNLREALVAMEKAKALAKEKPKD